MSTIPMPRIERVMEVEEIEKYLSAWELDFMTSVQEQVQAGQQLSWKQTEKFEAIEARLIEEGIL